MEDTESDAKTRIPSLSGIVEDVGTVIVTAEKIQQGLSKKLFVAGANLLERLVGCSVCLRSRSRTKRKKTCQRSRPESNVPGPISENTGSITSGAVSTSFPSTFSESSLPEVFVSRKSVTVKADGMSIIILSSNPVGSPSDCSVMHGFVSEGDILWMCVSFVVETHPNMSRNISPKHHLFFEGKKSGISELILI